MTTTELHPFCSIYLYTSRTLVYNCTNPIDYHASERRSSVIRTTYVREDILVLVKTYPNPSKKYIESSCTAGVTRSGEWLRLHPLPFRFLVSEKRFQKYQWIRTRIKKSTDPRPESHYIDIDSIEVLNESLSTENDWAQRRAFLEPLRKRSLERINDEQDSTNISLGFFQPKRIESLIIEPTAKKWTDAQLTALYQQQFFDTDKTPVLEKVPFDFKYKYTCDDPKCKGHTQSIVDWEIYQSWRKWRKQYGDGWEAKLRHRYEYEMQQRNDTHFIVGTMRDHPKSWIIIGLFYPPLAKKERQGVLL